METIIIEGLVNFGLPGLTMAGLVWFILKREQSMSDIVKGIREDHQKDKEQQNNFINKQSTRLDEQTRELGRLSGSINMIVSDLRDVRRKIGLNKEE